MKHSTVGYADAGLRYPTHFFDEISRLLGPALSRKRAESTPPRANSKKPCRASSLWTRRWREPDSNRRSRLDGRGLRDRLLSPLRVISFPVRPPGFASLSLLRQLGIRRLAERAME